MPTNEHRAARYRRLALDCIAMASTATADQARTLLLETAQAWMRLAEHYEADKKD